MDYLEGIFDVPLFIGEEQLENDDFGDVDDEESQDSIDEVDGEVLDSQSECMTEETLDNSQVVGVHHANRPTIFHPAFTSACKCNLCGCGHFVGIPGVGNVCSCGHKYEQHEFCR